MSKGADFRFGGGYGGTGGIPSGGATCHAGVAVAAAAQFTWHPIRGSSRTQTPRSGLNGMVQGSVSAGGSTWVDSPTGSDDVVVTVGNLTSGDGAATMIYVFVQ